MRELTEITSFITPDGIEYTFDSIYKALLSEEGLGMPTIEYLTQQGPYQHGQSIVGYRLEPRIIQLLLRHNGISRSDFWSNRSELLNVLRPNRSSSGTSISGTLRKTYVDGTKRDIDVVSSGGPIFSARSLDKWDEWGFTEVLRFTAFDPTFYNPDKKIINWANMIITSFAGFLEFPITFPITFGTILSNKSSSVTYGGTWRSFPKITLEGPLNNVVITNESTGEFIKLNYAISVGETVTIDLPYGNKTVVNDQGDNLIGVVSYDSHVASFHLAPEPEVVNGVNVLSITSSEIDENSAASIEYYERFIGI